MATQSPEAARIEDLLELGTQAIGKIIRKLSEEVDSKPIEERGKFDVRDLTDCVQALTNVQKENRAALEFMERHKPDPAALLTMLTEYLKGLPAAERAALFEAARTTRAS